MGATYDPNGTRGEEEWNDVFEALASGARRRLLASLLEAGPGEAVRLPDAAMAAGSPADAERTRIDLYHRHLPALADAGYVEWDREPFRASRGPDFQAVAVVLRALEAEAVLRPDALCADEPERPDDQRVDPGQF